MLDYDNIYKMLVEYANEMIEDGLQRDKISAEQLRAIFTTFCMATETYPDTRRFDMLCAEVKDALGLTQSGAESYLSAYLV